MASQVKKAPALIVSPIGEPDRATGAVDYRATLTEGDRPITLSFTLPRDGLITKMGDAMFRYTPLPQVNAESDTFTVIARDRSGAAVHATVTWINNNRAPVAVAPPTEWPPDPETGAVTVPITPRTLAPAPPAGPAMCAPDPFTGVVIGTCGGRGANCTHTASAPAKGAVLIDAATGAWAYRPTVAARHDAVADDATHADQHDSFTVTISDNAGGTTDLTVTVSLVTMITVPSYSVTTQIPVSVAPVGIASSPQGDYLYVTGFVDDAALTVIHTTDAMTTTIPLSFRPEGLAVGGDGRHLYVADPMGGRIAVIDTTDHSMAFVPVGNQPLRMALNGADLYVANNQDGTISVIDTIDNALIRTIPVGGHPYAVAAGGGRVYVTDYGFYGGQSTHSVSVIDAAAGIVVDSIPVGYYPTGIAMSPNGKRCYVSNDEGSYTASHPGTTTVINTTTGTVVDTLALGGCAVAVSDNGDQVYVLSNGYEKTFTSRLSIVDLRTGRIAAVPIHGTPNALAVSGNRIYVTDTWHSSVVQITARVTCVVDTDAANDPPKLTITEVDSHLFHAKAEDPDDDQVAYTATQPFSGTVTDLGGGRFRYRPNGRAEQGFVDHFAVIADDGHGGVVTKTVALIV
jgi:YVTN family beta-propeller protein